MKTVRLISFGAALACVAAAVLLAVRGSGPSATPAVRFTDTVVNSHTPVASQGTSSVCWIYAMLSAIETDRIMRGDSVCLSPAYLARRMVEDEFRNYCLSRGALPVSPRGTAARALSLIARHGCMRHSAYRPTGVSYDALARSALSLGRRMVGERRGYSVASRHLAARLDSSLGSVPKKVYMLGAEYTPEEFGRSVCPPGEYVALTSFTHHPFGTSFPLELRDNACRDLFLNVPADSLLGLMRAAVAAGRGVCWEGDISEPGFSFAAGTATLPAGTDLSQEARQAAFERYDTTDDHCMAVVGLARGSDGKAYFIMKNSWGTGNPYGGLMYVSEDYVRLKTIAVVLPREVMAPGRT